MSQQTTRAAAHAWWVTGRPELNDLCPLQLILGQGRLAAGAEEPTKYQAEMLAEPWNKRYARLLDSQCMPDDEMSPASDNDTRGALTVRVEKTTGGPNLYIGETLVRYWVGCAFDGEAEALADAIRSALAAPRQPGEMGAGVPKLKVFYGPMPESNGKSNFTAILYRDNGNDVLDIVDGVTLEVSEYPDRVRYEADRARFLIGEMAERPDIFAYDADKHSGYVEPAASAINPAYKANPIVMDSGTDSGLAASAQQDEREAGKETPQAAYDRYFEREVKVPGMPGIWTKSAFIAGWHEGRLSSRNWVPMSLTPEQVEALEYARECVVVHGTGNWQWVVDHIKRLTQCAQQVQADARFFMDHGLWHDRVTGQHMYTQDQYDELRRNAFHNGYASRNEEIELAKHKGECVDKDCKGCSEQVQADAGAVATIYAECRECNECTHVGINDESDTLAACHNCDWSGPSPVEDHCPGCAQTGTMTAACPKCGGKYRLIAERNIAAHPSPAAESDKRDVLTEDMRLDLAAISEAIAHGEPEKAQALIREVLTIDRAAMSREQSGGERG